MKQPDYQKMKGFYSGSVESSDDSFPSAGLGRQIPFGFHPNLLDIICVDILILASAMSICFWDALSNIPFFNLLYPLLSVGGQLLFAVSLIALLSYALRRRVFRY